MPARVPTWQDHSGLASAVSALADDVDDVAGQVVDLDGVRGVQIEELSARIAALSARLAVLEAPVPPPLPDPPVAPSMLVGTSLHRESGETLADAFMRRKTNWGAEPQCVRVFNSGAPQSWPLFGAAVPLVSFKFSPSSVVASTHDSSLRAFFGKAPIGRPVRWTYFHEPEDNVEAGEFTSAAYRAAFAHIYRLAQLAVPAGSKVTGGPVLMGWTVNPSSRRNLADYLPATAPVDFIGWDIYPDYGSESIRGRYKLAVDATKAAGVSEWLLAEASIHQPANYTAEQKADWVRRAVPVAAELGFTEWHYFDSTTGGDFRLRTPVEWSAIGDAIRG